MEPMGWDRPVPFHAGPCATHSNKSLCQLFVRKKPLKNMLNNVTLAADTINTNNTSN